MEVRVHEDMKLVEVWLTRQEQADDILREQLRKMYQDYKSRKYMVAQFHSGGGDLYAITRDLLIFNRKRIEELAVALEKGPDITTSYSQTLPIQC
ncbi:MAG: hypothetical protein IJ001_09810 [Oscillospiraceae bacterium]|nr:hypothetical protein [Oscillospiraceae bacterium]